MEEKKLLYLRSFSLFCVTMAIPVGLFMVFLGGFSYIRPIENITFDFMALANQFVYFTIWSNVLAFVWVILAFVSTVTKNEKLTKFVEHPSVKLTPFIMMFITMTVSFIILYPIGFIWLLHKFSTTQAILLIIEVMFLTPLLFQHLLVAVVLLLDLIFTKGYRVEKEETMNDKLKAMGLSMIIPIVWMFLSIIAIETGFIPPQYPFMAIFVRGADLTPTQVIFSILTLVCIIMTWVFIWFTVAYYTNKNSSE